MEPPPWTKRLPDKQRQLTEDNLEILILPFEKNVPGMPVFTPRRKGRSFFFEERHSVCVRILSCVPGKNRI